MWYRQVKKFYMAKPRLLGSLAQPILWMVFFGLGWSSTIRGPMARMLFHGLDYMSFLAPGVYMMSIFIVSFMSGVSVIFDRQFGYLKELLASPAPREAIMLGRVLGDSTVSIAQATVLLMAAKALAPGISLATLPVASLVGFLAALCFTSLGSIIAFKMETFESFNIVNTFITMPMLFLSGAFYPIDTMPAWMRHLAYVSPLTYAVDATRGLLAGYSHLPLAVDAAALLAAAAALLLLSAAAYKRATVG